MKIISSPQVADCKQ